MRESFVRVLAFVSKPAVAIGGSLAIGAVIIGGTWYALEVQPTGAYSPVTEGPLTEEVDVSGTVQAAHSTDLAFQVGGRIANINVAVGDHVAAGQVLLSLDGAAEAAVLAQAKAALQVQQANLASLMAGTRPEQLAVDETNLAQAQVALANAAQSAYVAGDAAVHSEADQLFTNPRTQNAQLAFVVPDATLVNRINAERAALERVFLGWQQSLATASDTAAVASESAAALGQIGAFLDDVSKALAETPAGGSLSETALTADSASINAARVSVSGALASLTAANTGYKGAQGALTLAQAGATPEALEAQQAAVAVAQAAVESAQVAASQTVLVAPVSGTITVQDANPGQTVTPGVPLVSMVADGKYQAVAQVSQADIAKLKVGQEVEVTSDTYPGVTFPAHVTTVDPAATVRNGVASYGITVTFDANDPRLSDGLSANLRVTTATLPNALQVPSSAIITDATSTFVYVKGAHGPVMTPVTTGVESGSGMTEVVSGLSKGDSVLTFGASASAAQ